MENTVSSAAPINSQDPTSSLPKSLPIMSTATSHTFMVPTKRIHSGADVPHFLSSHAYTSIALWIMQLNHAMCPRLLPSGRTQTWPLSSPNLRLPRSVLRLRRMLDRIDAIVEEAPPETGPRRFGNVAFRTWYALLEGRVDDLLDEGLDGSVLRRGGEDLADEVSRRKMEAGEVVTAREELKAYLLGGFGSAQRLDYGTGHELSFLAFLGCVWKLGGLVGSESETESETMVREGDVERSIVVGIIEPYLRVVRKLILTYTLEPAGSHGVWGLDDHSFLPYVFGSAQYCPPIEDGDATPLEGSLSGAPDPGSVTKKEVVEAERQINMYFAAVGFIYDVKNGPFWEHSPILFDISGIRSGWGKINKGMIKMYNAEVLSKFPVVQHFPFGSLFSWDMDPDVPTPTSSTHVASQPSAAAVPITSDGAGLPPTRPPPQEETRAPWASQNSSTLVATAAPWVGQTPSAPLVATTAPWGNPRAQRPHTSSARGREGPRGDAEAGLPTRFGPPQVGGVPPPATNAPWVAVEPNGGLGSGDVPTRAPWVKAPSVAGET